MEWKTSNFLMIEGESARPGTFIGTDARETNLTPEFLKNVFKSFNKYQPLYLTHEDDEPMGIITSLGYSEDSDTICWKGIAFDAEKCKRAEKEGFDFFSPDFSIFENIVDGKKDTPLRGLFTGGALVRNPAIKTNTTKKSWVSFSEPTEDVDNIVEEIKHSEIVLTPTLQSNTSSELNAQLIEQLINEKIKNIDKGSDKIKLPEGIKQPKWVKLDNGGYVIMDENTKVSNSVANEHDKQDSRKFNELNPEQIAQIEIAKRNLEEKQKSDAELIKTLTSELEKTKGILSKESEDLKKYRERFESAIGSEITAAESELRGFGFEKPEDYAKDFDVESRLKILNDAKKQFVKGKSITAPLDVTIEDANAKVDLDKTLIELDIPMEYKKYIKPENI